MVQSDKNIDLELLFFYLIGAMFSFGIYIVSHPLFYFFNKEVDFASLFIAYLPDLMLFLIVFIPYCAYIVVLMIQKIFYKMEINNNVFVVLFFPLISFISKGMSLYRIYDVTISIDMIKNNLVFIMSIFIGPAIILFNNIIVKVRHKVKTYNKRNNG